MQYEDFGNFIRNKRKQEGISLNSFALNCEIEPASLSNFERGKNDILFYNFLKIAKGFNKTPAKLLFEYENKNY